MNRILAALDGSPRAEGVLKAAIGLARADGGRLFLMRSIGLLGSVPKDLWQSTDAPMIDVLNDRACEYLEKFEPLVPPAIRGGTRVAIGSPWEAICQTAASLGVDLVVVGSHGYGGVDRMLGTTAAKVVNHCACSVLVVKSAPAVEKPVAPADPE